MKQGAVIWLVFGGGTSLIQNIDNVEAGTKTIEQASLDVAVDTAISGAVGVCAGAGVHGTGRIIAKMANAIMRKYNFVARLSKAERLLGKELTKSQKQQILKAHVSKGGAEEKARILKDFTKKQKRVLMEGWVVGKPEKLIRKIMAETNGHRLADLAEKIPGLKKIEGPTHYKILKNGVKITEIPRHTTLKKGTLISIRKILIAELGG